jgi:Calponin homology (CH) domain
MNRLLKAAGAPTIVYRTKAPSSFVALANIESFIAAVKAYGVPDTSLFQPADLFEGRKGPLLYVLACLDQLGKLV